MSATGWVKTVDGSDVYTEDHEWFYSDRAGGWFHSPGLLTMPAVPADVRARSLFSRLRYGWPRVLGRGSGAPIPGGMWTNIPGGGFVGPFVDVFVRLTLAWMWLYRMPFAEGHGYGDSLRSLQAFVYGVYVHQWTSRTTYGTEWFADAQNETDALGYALLYFLVTIVCLITMYTGWVAAHDPVKGWAIAGVAVGGHLIRQSARNASERRIREQTEAIRRAGGH